MSRLEFDLNEQAFGSVTIDGHDRRSGIPCVLAPGHLGHCRTARDLELPCVLGPGHPGPCMAKVEAESEMPGVGYDAQTRRA